MKNLNIRKRAASLALAGTLTFTSLVGCGSQISVENEVNTNEIGLNDYAIIFDNSTEGPTATIVEIDLSKTNLSMYKGSEDVEWFLELVDGSIIVVDICDDVKILKDFKLENVETMIKYLKGEDIIINYYSEVASNVKSR